MRMKFAMVSMLYAVVLAGGAIAPTAANAQNWERRAHRHRIYNERRDHRNECRNIAIGAGALGLIGALEHDDTLYFAGTAGSLYSLYRYDQDRRSHDRVDRFRARYFGRPYFYRDGAKYYQFE